LSTGRGGTRGCFWLGVCTRDGALPHTKFMEASNPAAMPPSAQANINAIVRLEEQALKQRTVADRISDAIANFVGSIPFVAMHVAWFGIWVGLNAGLWKFDPYPFALLCMLVSLEGVLLSTFVLIKQNRMSQRADHRSHLDLQINLLAEKEVTKILQLQRLICQRLGIEEAEADREVSELSHVTAVENLARELHSKIPTDRA
jgi:uncharacterized membrane protein